MAGPAAATRTVTEGLRAGGDPLKDRVFLGLCDRAVLHRRIQDLLRRVVRGGADGGVADPLRLLEVGEGLAGSQLGLEVGGGHSQSTRDRVQLGGAEAP